jgi:protein-S-isoprenylcysteine O-methyltransferase Ste14
VTNLLEALDWKVSVGSAMRLVAIMAAVTIASLLLGTALAEVLGLPIVVVQGGIWALWLTWLGLVFPRNRRSDEDSPCATPYRRAFKREILLGVAVAFSQLLRPAFTGLLADGRELPSVPSVAVGLPLSLLGISIVTLGVAALGIARTLFVYEYVPTDKPLRIVGIFRFLRHPLFLGGSMVSLGLAVCTGVDVAIELAALNACVIPIYVQLEDRRCCATLGRAYADYRALVGGVIPRRRSAISPSAFVHQASGSIEPITPRSLVKTW